MHLLNPQFILQADCTHKPGGGNLAGNLVLATQEHHPVWPRTSEYLPMGGKKLSPGGKEVRREGCCNIWRLTTSLPISKSSHSAFMISKMCRLRVLWYGRPEGCWKGKGQIRSDAQYALPVLDTHTVPGHCQALGSGNRPRGVDMKKTPNIDNLGH